MKSLLAACCALALVVACSDAPPTESAAAEPLSAPFDPPATPNANAARATEPDAAASDAAAVPDAASAPDAAKPAPLAAKDVLAKLANCTQISNGKFKNDSSDATGTIPICGLTNAVFWTADMDIDCDGKVSTACNSTTDPWFMNETAATDASGDPLDAASLPFVVVPLKSTRFDYAAHGIALGTVVMVIYNGKYEFGIVGDLGPSAVIGEASYAMADKLGIDPNPKTGGVSSGVTYVVFTGKTGVATKLDDHDEAARIGEARARQFVAEN